MSGYRRDIVGILRYLYRHPESSGGSEYLHRFSEEHSDTLAAQVGELVSGSEGIAVVSVHGGEGTADVLVDGGGEGTAESPVDGGESIILCSLI